MFNAREDNLFNVHTRLLQSNRCVVPLEGFFEWNQDSTGKKQPYLVSSKNKTQLAVAGVWDEWQDGDGRCLRTFSLITVAVSEEVNVWFLRFGKLAEPFHSNVFLMNGFGYKVRMRVFQNPLVFGHDPTLLS
jgi:putative SOS response-associated peptidase YedK